MSRFDQVMMAAFEDELVKIAEASAPKAGLLKGKGKALGTAALAIGGYEMARRANEDRKMGKALRKGQLG